MSIGQRRAHGRGALARFCVAAFLLAVCLVLQAVFSHGGEALFPAYRDFSKACMGGLASLMSMVPFAVWDWAALVLVLVFLVGLVRCVVRRHGFLSWLSVACLIVSAAYTVFVAGWALNHYAPPLADELGLEVGQSSTDELAYATRSYLNEAARRAVQVPREEDGTLVRQDFFELAGIAGASYEGLAAEYPVFVGSSEPVKALLLWGEPLLYSGHTGIFWAPTGESGVPLNCAVVDMPFIMCHETAHRLGLAGEQEANFAAFMACAASDDARFAYAGYYQAFGYCFNALYAASPDLAEQVVADAAATELAEGVAYLFADRAATREHYDAYDGPFKEVGTTVNDSYLKGFGEEVGVRSYGLVVDYLIAWSGRTT